MILFQSGVACIKHTSIYMNIARSRRACREVSRIENWIKFLNRDVISFSEARRDLKHGPNLFGTTWLPNRERYRVARHSETLSRGIIPQTNGDSPIEWARSVSYVKARRSFARFRTAALREKCIHAAPRRESAARRFATACQLKTNPWLIRGRRVVDKKEKKRGKEQPSPVYYYLLLVYRSRVSEGRVQSRHVRRRRGRFTAVIHARISNCIANVRWAAAKIYDSA